METRALVELARAPRTPDKIRTRARVLLQVLKRTKKKGNRVPMKRIAETIGVSRSTVYRLAHRYGTGGVAALCTDMRHPGRPSAVSAEKERAIIEATLHACAADGTRWTVRKLAVAQGVSRGVVQRLWKKHRIMPEHIAGGHMPLEHRGVPAGWLAPIVAMTKENGGRVPPQHREALELFAKHITTIVSAKVRAADQRLDPDKPDEAYDRSSYRAFVTAHHFDYGKLIGSVFLPHRQMTDEDWAHRVLYYDLYDQYLAGKRLTVPRTPRRITEGTAGRLKFLISSTEATHGRRSDDGAMPVRLSISCLKETTKSINQVIDLRNWGKVMHNKYPKVDIAGIADCMREQKMVDPGDRRSLTAAAKLLELIREKLTTVAVAFK